MPRDDRIIDQQQSVRNESLGSSLDETAAHNGDTRPQERPPFAAPAAPTEVGRLGKYRILRELGRGGMGAVYLAHDERLRRKVALKVMLPKFAADAEAKNRFLREARAAAQISSDYVVSIYEAEEIDGIPFIALQYLQGMALDQYLKANGPLSPAQILRIGREAALGLAAAHQIGLVHRDIKPGNLWLEAPSGRVKILDFGLAKSVEGDVSVDLTGSGVLVGTPVYMSPEQARGEKVDGRTDLYSLGGVLFRLCTGNLPVKGNTPMAVLASLVADTPTPIRELNPSIPEPLAAITHQLLAKRADQRPATAQDLAARLMQITKELTTPAILAATPVSVQPLPFAELATAESDPMARTRNTAATLTLEPVPVIPSTSGGPRRLPLLWLVGGGLALLALILVAGGIIITIRNKDGTVTKIEAPPGAKVEVNGKPIEPSGSTARKIPIGDSPPSKDAFPGVLAVFQTFEDPKNSEVFQGNRDDGQYAIKNGSYSIIATKPKPFVHYKSLFGPPASDTAFATRVRCSGGLIVVGFRILHTADRARWLSLVIHPNGSWVFQHANSDVVDGKWLSRNHVTLKQSVAANPEMANGKWIDIAGRSEGGEYELWINGQSAARGTSEAVGTPAISGVECTAEAKGGEPLLFDIAHVAMWKNVASAANPDRKAAEYVLSIGGAVRVVGKEQEFRAAAELPKEAFLLNAIYLPSNLQVVDADLAKLQGCRNLTELHMPGTRVGDEGLAHLKDCNLVTLVLNSTRVTDAGLAHLKGCKNLSQLHVHGTRVTDAGLAHLNNCKNLTVLAMNNTQVSDAGLAYFKGSKTLTQLHLEATRVTDAGLTPFKDCSTLTYLDVRKTKVTAAMVAELCKALPKCRIESDHGTFGPK